MDYDTQSYNDLRKLTAERGLNSAGTKDELIARLQEADKGANPPEGGTGAPPVTQDPKPATGVTKGTKVDIEKAYRNKAAKIKALLDKQPKVMVFIPFESGENPTMAAKIKLPVNINGYQFDIPRGVAVHVPQQVAEMVQERLESEGKAGRQFRVDADEARQTALTE